jgi:hypothetical protein
VDSTCDQDINDDEDTGNETSCTTSKRQRTPSLEATTTFIATDMPKMNNISLTPTTPASPQLQMLSFIATIDKRFRERVSDADIELTAAIKSLPKRLSRIASTQRMVIISTLKPLLTNCDTNAGREHFFQMFMKLEKRYWKEKQERDQVLIAIWMSFYNPNQIDSDEKESVACTLSSSSSSERSTTLNSQESASTIASPHEAIQDSSPSHMVIKVSPTRRHVRFHENPCPQHGDNE